MSDTALRVKRLRYNIRYTNKESSKDRLLLVYVYVTFHLWGFAP